MLSYSLVTETPTSSSSGFAPGTARRSRKRRRREAQAPSACWAGHGAEASGTLGQTGAQRQPGPSTREFSPQTSWWPGTAATAVLWVPHMHRIGCFRDSDFGFRRYVLVKDLCQLRNIFQQNNAA